MKHRPLLRSLLAVALLAPLAAGAETEIFGELDWGWRTTFDDEFTPANYSNHKLNLGARVRMDEGVRLEAEIQHFSTVRDANGDRERTRIYDGKGRVSNFYEDPDAVRLRALRAMWDFVPGGSIGLGDAFYSIGTPHNADAWAENEAIMSERGIRGAIFELSGFTGGFGIPFDPYAEEEIRNKSFTVYGQYDIPVLDNRRRSLSVVPAVEINFNNGRTRVWNLGAEVHYADSWKGLPCTVDMAAGYLDVRTKPVWTMLFEPSLSTGDFSLGGTFYYATLNSSDASGKQAELDELDIPVQMFLGVEPMVRLHRKFALGLPVLWNNPMVDVDDDEWTTVALAGRFWPTDGASSVTALRYHKIHSGSDFWEFAWSLSFEF